MVFASDAGRSVPPKGLAAGWELPWEPAEN